MYSNSHKEDQPVTRRFFLKAVVPNLLFQKLWHVRGACQSFPQSKPPTSLCSWKQKVGCGLVKSRKQPVWGCTLQINWITVQPHGKLSQKKPEGKWTFLASELRYLPVSSCCLPFLPGCNWMQHINPSSVATQGQTKINCTRTSVLLPVKPTALSFKFAWTAQPFFLSETWVLFCPLQIRSILQQCSSVWHLISQQLDEPQPSSELSHCRKSSEERAGNELL